MRKILIFLIRTYQYFSKGIYTSPLFLFPSNCRFYPTCSSYAIEAISKEGVTKGGLMAFVRILRCNPFKN